MNYWRRSYYYGSLPSNSLVCEAIEHVQKVMYVTITITYTQTIKHLVLNTNLKAPSTNHQPLSTYH